MSDATDRLWDFLPETDFSERGVDIKDIAVEFGYATSIESCTPAQEKACYNGVVYPAKGEIRYDENGNRLYWCRNKIVGMRDRSQKYFKNTNVVLARKYGHDRDGDILTRTRTTRAIHQDTLEIGGMEARDATSVAMADDRVASARLTKALSRSYVDPAIREEIDRFLPLVEATTNLKNEFAARLEAIAAPE